MTALARVGVLFAAIACVAVPVAAQDDAVKAAGVLRRQGRPAEAVAVLEGARGAGGDATLEGMLGLCALDAKRWEQCDALAAAWGDYDGDDYRLVVFLGRHAATRGDGEAGRLRLERATTLRERPIEARLELVELLLRLPDLGAALVQAEALEAVEPSVGRPQRARVLRAQGEHQARKGPEALPKAVEKYREAYAADPSDPLTAALLLDGLILMVRAEEAAEVIESLYGAGRDPLAYHWRRAQVELAAKRIEPARAQLARVLSLDPAHVEARLESARLALDAGDHPGARAHLDACPPATPHESRRRLLLGLLALDLQDDGAAEQHLRAAVALQPGNTKALYHLGRLLMKLGRRDEGAEILERYQALAH